MKFKLKLSKRQEWLRDCVVHHHLTGLDFVKYKIVNAFINHFHNWMNEAVLLNQIGEWWEEEKESISFNIFIDDDICCGITSLQKAINKTLKKCGVDKEIDYQTVYIGFRKWKESTLLKRQLLQQQPY